MTRHELSGRTFARLTVLRSVPFKGHGPTRAIWRCRCECGNELDVPAGNLRSGNTKSCGCLNRQAASDRQKTHGLSKSAEYVIWTHIIDRCENPNSPAFKNWGGRGIRICDKWRRDFTAFLSDVGPRPSRSHQIDRIDNDGDYKPSNVRWATRSQQMSNRRSFAHRFHRNALGQFS